METPPGSSAPVSGDVISGGRMPTDPDPATEVESGDSQSASRPEPVRDAEREPRPAESAAAGSPGVEAGWRVSEPEPIQESELPEWIRIDWEQTLGRNWFAIVGALAVVLGIGFFLKLAFDNNWINDTGRVALGVAVGLALLGGGSTPRERFLDGRSRGRLAGPLSCTCPYTLHSDSTSSFLPTWPSRCWP